MKLPLAKLDSLEFDIEYSGKTDLKVFFEPACIFFLIVVRLIIFKKGVSNVVKKSTDLTLLMRCKDSIYFLDGACGH